MNKRNLLLGTSLLFIVGLASGCQPVSNHTPITLAEVTHSIFYAPVYVADEMGFFEDEGLDVSFITTPGADRTMAALLSGEAQIGLMGPEASIYVYLGGQLNYAVNFAQLTQKDGSFLVGRNDEDPFDFDVLKNKTIIGGRKGGMPEMVLEYVLKQKGLEVGQNDPTKEVNVRTDVSFDVMSGVFEAGQSDYVTLFEPNATLLEKNGKGYVLASIGEESGEIPYTAFSTLKNYMRDNEETIQKFTNAIYKALIWVNNNTAETIAPHLATYFTTSTSDELVSVVARYKGIEAWPTDVTLHQAGFEKLMDIMELADELDTRAPYATLVTSTYSEAAKED